MSTYLVVLAVLMSLLSLAGYRVLSVANADPCLKAPVPLQCWGDTVDMSLARGDIQSALRDITRYSSSEPLFGEICHGLMHDVGAVAYGDFREGRVFSYSPHMEMCSFGFFHGFMEALFGDTNSLADARRFCTEVDSEGNVHIPRRQCFHGIGHGVVDGHNPLEWQDVSAVMERSVTLCKEIAEDSSDALACLGGVFNGVANAYWRHEYGLFVSPEDPFAVCRSILVNDGRADCYGYMARALLSIPPADFESAVRLAQAHTPPEYLLPVIGGIAIIESLSGKAEEDVRSVCETIPLNIRQACAGSYARGIVQASDTSKAEERALAFCEHWRREVRDACILDVRDELTKYRRGDI